MAIPNYSSFYNTSVAQGMFNTSSEGMRQGTAFPDPATRNALRTCVLDDTETLPMWGGIGVYENVPGVAGDPRAALGPVCGRASDLTGSKALAGFSVFDGAYAMVTAPGQNVPLAWPGEQVMTYALGSRARIVVAADPILVDLRGTPIGSNVSWDFIAQRLVPYLGTLTITSGTYNNTTGVITLLMAAPVGFGPGDTLTLSSLTGTGAFASLNGSWEVLTATGSTATLAATPAVGASTITGGSATLGSGASVALPVKVLDIQATNCIVVNYDAIGQTVMYDFDGAAAVIQI